LKACIHAYYEFIHCSGRNVEHDFSSTIKITEKASCLSSHYMVYIQCSRPFSIYMIFTGSIIRFTGPFIRLTSYLQAPLFHLHENVQAPLFDLHENLQASLFDLHGIYSYLYSI